MTDLSFAAYMRSPQCIYTYDAGVSAIMGVAFLTGADVIADFVGWPGAAGFITSAGAFLLSWALFNYALGTAGSSSRSAIYANILGDGAWVGLSVLLLALYWNQFNLWGHLLLVGQTLFVIVVLAIKLRGLRALWGS